MWAVAMRNLAPDIPRQRLLIEGFYGVELTRESVGAFLAELAVALGSRAYGEPIVYSPAAGSGRPENAGFDAFIPLIDSGIAMYVWSERGFFSLVVYTCKPFEPARAVEFVRTALGVTGEIATQEF